MWGGLQSARGFSPATALYRKSRTERVCLLNAVEDDRLLWAAATARRRRTAPPGEHAPGQSHRIIVRHLKIRGNPTRLRHPGNRLSRHGARLNIQHRRIPDLIHSPADL